MAFTSWSFSINAFAIFTSWFKDPAVQPVIEIHRMVITSQLSALKEEKLGPPSGFFLFPSLLPALPPFLRAFLSAPYTANTFLLKALELKSQFCHY